ncbi:MAG: histidine kinase [Hydrococcus sp. Prado102]|jgi:hypothetical protein|nr:histidine kinase [Hydrococcus sp. Prado102]
MSSSIKEKISEDLQKAKAQGQLRAERIREIVKYAVRDTVFNAAAEVKEGAVEIREIIKDVIATVAENLKDKNQEIKEEIAASVKGAIEGVSEKKRQELSQAQEEVRQLQENIDRQEIELDEEINSALVHIESTETGSDKIKSAIASAVKTIRDSEEFGLMQKRYAQLQAQLSVLKANIEARYGENNGEDKTQLINKYLEDAKNWYREAQKWAQTDGEKSLLQQRQEEFERKAGEAGGALARKERQVLQLLKELWMSMRDSHSKSKNDSSVDKISQP